jgi:hypothetical protein
VECAFCGERTVDPLTAVIFLASRDYEREPPSQQIWFHGACLAARLHESVPFDAEAFVD